MLYWIIAAIGFLFASGIIILIALFYDHRNNLSLAIQYVVGFIIMMTIGVIGVFMFHIYFALLIPIWIFGMLLIKKIFENKTNESETLD